MGVLVLIGAMGACSSGDGAQPAAAPSSVAASPAAAAPAASPDAAGHVMAATTAETPVDAAIRLEALLGQHSILVSDMMRAAIRKDADLAQAATAALSQNTTALGGVLEPVVGAEAAQQFATLWGNHIQGFYTYARGRADKDDAAADRAKSELQGFEGDIAAFLSAGSKGRLPQEAAEGAVRSHVDHLLEGADAYAAGEFEESAEIYRTSYSHTFDLGATLANSLLPAEVTKQLATPPVQLRASLTKLLTEHVALVVAAMRSSAGDKADFDSMGTALNGNTADLAGAIDSLFGAEAARGFQGYWADHVDQLLTYTQATEANDAAGKEKARAALRTFEREFATFFNDATQNRLGAPALTQAYVMHDRELLAQIDAYHAQQFEQAHSLANQTYEHMMGVATQLAGAIGATLAGKLPSGGSQTGGGGAAAVVGAR